MQQKLFTPPKATPNRGTNETTFVDNMRLPVHRWFRFSAGYSGQWVEDVLKAADRPQPVVLDPFAGSGTTLLAAAAQGSESFGWEAQPFIHRIARAKTGGVSVDPEALLAAGSAILKRAIHDSAKGEPETSPLLLKCYEPEALEGLRSLQRAIADENGELPPEVWDLLWLALVSILRPVSHVGTAQWQYVLPNKSKAKTITPFDGFEAKVDLMARDLVDVGSDLAQSPMHLIYQDAREETDIEENSIDLVVTSPPYANNYDYADATRLEMTFLGEVTSWGDLKKVRAPLVHACSQHMTGYDADTVLDDPLLAPIIDRLGPIYEDLSTVRLTKGGKKAYHSMIVGYFFDMARVWRNVRHAVADGGVAHFVIGDSAPYGVYVPVDVFLGDLAVASGFDSYTFAKSRDRNIKWKNRKHRVPLKEGVLEVRG